MRAVDFLLECIGFPPDQDLGELGERVRRTGEPTAWRGPAGEHLRLPLAGGLELRVEREPGEDTWNVWPYYGSTHRLRVAVRELRSVPDSPWDVLLHGTANPTAAEHVDETARSFPLCTWLTDARRLPRKLRPGHVLAVSIAGFALDVGYVGPNSGSRDASFLELPRGAWFDPLGGVDDPGGCMEVSLRVREVRHIVNPLTDAPALVLETDAPGRPVEVFVSPWQLEREGLPMPRPGWRIEGTFVFTGRLAGGLPPVRPRRERSFG